ncbi:hypothetical protein AVEN_171636-1 [Araneus ventricosus]|uniref:Mariner Mos1 transposase n=1 Tax=Araneus ventricosus TaxID=182803 RepID=A0A4Y2EZC8_ARAVE|nr:hypothetical protein AVEN_171636-1 [Araneus ventricosus]
MLKHVYGDDIVTLKTVYCDMLKLRMTRIRRVRPYLKQPGSWFLLHDNARRHTARLVKRFLALHGVTYLPPTDFSCFLNSIKGEYLQTLDIFKLL